ncbi:LOW QUALITY PROTEIN: uncharacterized protein LOC117325169 [Pecten maximus]|uniref:LOW QUALITY PROTEIN: uncharacterized protein LOC117325169 n=1 Tax=Pecten maximus TaxID=6579 RepID=UPI001458E012|nr:LOW QUALITY PROTEIN: uncharacterized protein LOC117325169 [Pecten maximus]
MDFNTATVFLAIVAGSFAGPVTTVTPVSSGSCARECTESSKFLYQPGTVYEFRYEGKTSTGIHGASEDNAGLRITASALIGVISKCEFTLELSNTILYGADPDRSVRLRRHSDSREFKTALQSNPLRFSFQDGVIDQLCPSDDEPTWVLNIKRGILSAFQNGMESLDGQHEVSETDVTGTCPTTYKMIQDGWKTRTVKKTKDMSACTERHGFDSSAHSMLYRVPSSIQSLPLMKSTHECDQEFIVQEKILKRSICHEIHLFRPFSKEDNGATTEVMQKLIFVSSESRSVSQADVSRRESILFEHEGGERGTTVNYQSALSKLNELCTSTQTDIRPDTPRAFSELVYELKKLDSLSLNSVFRQVSDPSFCPNNSERVKKFYLDAIPMVGTGAAVSQITERIMNNDISVTFVEMWLASLSFVQHPTKEMLSEVMRLLDMPNGDKVILPVSALVHSYCRDNTQCADDAEVDDIMTWLENKIGDNCQYSDNTYMQVLLSLRAVGNIGISQRIIPNLSQCFKSIQATMEMRLAAVEAFRRFPCNADRSELMMLYKDSSEDSEIRIAAYLEVMKCASSEVINEVKEVLAAEEVNQVGSFVWTHLTNLMETSDPTKQDIRAILEDEVLQREFDMDRRKFSRNYEASYFSEKFNIGGSMESNLVWSPKSFVPRSLMANLTVDLFGHSYNLLEVGGRAEGLEHLLEAYFGPSGHLRKNKASSPAPEMPTNKALNMNKLNRMGNTLDSDEDLQGSMYMRVFGNEVKYLNLKKVQGSDNNLNNFDFDAIFAKLIRDGSVSYTYSNMFLDSSIIIPTLIGFPLNLTVNGTLTTGLTGTGKIDLRKPKSLMLMNGNIEPSGAVAISAMMSVDAFVTKGGMKMVSTLHTSTAIRGKLELSNNKDFTLELDFPRKKSEVINMESSFFMVQGDQEKVQNMLDNNVATMSFCTGNTLARISGLNTCIKAKFPNTSDDAPLFPFNGPVSVSVKTTNQDLPNGYQFQLKRTVTDEQTMFLISYDTPGSVRDRAVGFNLDIHHTDRTMEMNLLSPWKKARFTGNLVNTESLKKIEGSLVVDTTRTYNAVFEVKRMVKKRVINYTPRVLITIPSKDSISLTGEVAYVKQTSLTGDLVLTGAHAEPVHMNGALISSGKRKKMEWNVLLGDVKKFAALVDVPFIITGSNVKLSPVISATIPGYHDYNSTGTLEYRKNKMMKTDITINGFTEDPITFNSIVKFSQAEKGIKVKFSHEENKNYEGEVKLMVRQMKSKSTQYLGQVILKTPTKFLAQVKSRLVHKVDASVKFELTVDKITKVPIKIKGLVTKMTKKQLRTFYKVSGTLHWSKETDGRVKFDVDKRQNAIFTNIKLSYNFLKLIQGAKDQLDFNGKVVRSLKAVRSYELATNFKSSRFGIYNNKMNMKGSYRPGKLADAVLVFDYGRNYLNKDNKRRVAFNAQTNYRIRNANVAVAYSFSCNYPWKSLLVTLDGNHVHDEEKVNSTMTLTHNTKQMFDAAIMYNDDSNKGIPSYSGEIAMNVDGRPIGITARVSETRDREYQGTVSVQHEKKKITTLTTTYRAQSEREKSYEVASSLELYDGKRTEVTAIYTHPSNTSHRINTGIQWYDGTSFTSQGALNLDKGSPLASLAFAFGSNNYAMSLSGENKPGYRRVASNIQYPSRRIVVEMGAGMKANKYMVLGDVQWDADNHADSRVKVEGTYRNEGVQNFETGVLVQVPDHLYSAFIRHLSTTKYNTAVEFAWAPTKKIEAEFEFEDSLRKYRRDIKAMAGFSTPFEKFEEMKTTWTYNTNKRQVSSSLAFKYARGKTLSLSVTAKKPVTINSVNLKLILGTAHPRIGEASLTVSHLLSKDMTHHTAESTLEWGSGQRAYIETTSDYSLRRKTRSYRRDIGFVSNIPTWELVKLNITHLDDFRQFDSKAVYNRNNEIYHYHTIHDFTITGGQIQNSGTFNITSPKDSLHLVWSHENTDRNIDSSATVSWNNGQRFSTSLYGDIQYSPTKRITGRFDAEIPSTQINRIRARFEHADRPGKINTSGHIHADGENIITVEANYGRQLGSVDYDMMATSVYMSHDFTTTLNTRHAVMPYTGQLEIEWEPEQKINVDGNMNLIPDMRKFDGTMTLTSPFKYARHVIVEASHKLEGLEWVAATDVEFAPQRKFTSEVRYRVDELIKLGRFTLTTPIAEISRLDTGIQFSGHPQDFAAVGSLEVIPWVPRHELSTNWLLNELQLKGDFNFKSPAYSYANAQVSSSMVGTSRTSNVALEYIDQQSMRPQKMTLVSDYTIQDNIIDGTINFVCPYTQPIIVQFTQTGDFHDFNQRSTIRYNRNKEIVSNLEFGDNPNIFGKLTLNTPYRGTENVEVGFVHDGTEWQKFKTEAVYGTNGKKIVMEAGLNVLDALNGKVAIRSPFPALQIAQMSFSHDSDRTTLTTHGDMIFNEYVVEEDLSLRHDSTVTIGSFSVRSPIPRAEELRFTFSKDGIPTKFMVHGEAFRNSDKVEVDINFEHNDRTTSGTISGRTNLNDIEDVTLTFSREGQLTDFTAENSIRYGEHKVDSLVGFSHNDHVTTGRIVSRGFITLFIESNDEDVTVSFSRKGSLLNFQNQGMVMIGQRKYESRVEFAHNQEETTGKWIIPIPKGDSIEIATVTFSRQGQLNDIAAHGKVVYEQKKVEIRSSFALTDDDNINGRFNLESSFPDVKPLRLSFSKEGSLPSNFRTQGLYMYDQQSFESEAVLSMDDNSLTSKFQMTSNAPGVKDITVTLTKQGTLAEGVQSELLFVMGEDGRIGSKLEYSHSESRTTGKFEYEGFKSIALSFSRAGVLLDLHLQAMGKFDQHSLQSEWLFQHGDTETRGKLSTSNTFLQKKSMEIVFYRTGTLENLKAGGKFVCDDDSFDATIGFSHDETTTMGLFNTTSTLEQVKDLRVSITRTANRRVDSVTGEAVYGTLSYTANLDKKTTGDDILVTGTITNPHTEDITFTIDHNSRRKGFTSTLTGNMGDSNSLLSTAEFTHRGNVLTFVGKNVLIVDGENTWTEKYTLNHKGEPTDFKTKAVYVYNNKEFDATLTVRAPSVDNAVLELVATTPFDDYRNLLLTFGNVKNGPTHSSSLDITYGSNTISATSTVDIESPQKTVNVQFTSPYEGAESGSLGITHRGESMSDFETIAILTASSLTTPARGEVMLNYNTLTDIEASTKLIYEDLNRQADFMLQLQDMQFATRVNLQSQAKSINLESSGNLHISPVQNSQTDHDIDIQFKAKLLTPFEHIRNADLQYVKIDSMQSDHKSGMENILVRHNDLTYYRKLSTFEYQNGLINQSVSEFSDAIAWGYSYKILFDLPLTSLNFESTASSDLTSPDSSYRMVGNAVVERNGDIIESVETDLQGIHSSRTVALRGGWTKKFPVLPNHMEVSWDENKGQKAGYNIKWGKVNRLVKFMSPVRSMELRGRLVEKQPTKIREYELFWDAEKDRNQRASVRMETAPDQRKTVRLGLNIPTNNGIKEFSVVSEFARQDNGHYNSRTELSYSTDPSKTIVLTSRYDDLSRGDTNNCSLTIGLSHAHSHMDVSATSHIGSGPTRRSAGISLSTSTTQRQIRNLFLMGEIDTLRKHMSVMAIGPTKSVGLTGEVRDSPYRLALRSTHDAENLIDAEVSYDEQNKALNMQMKYDSEHPNNVLHLMTQYPNNMDFSAEMYRTGDFPRVSESLIKLHLKSSRLLHTKVQWRPEMVSDLMGYIANTLQKYGNEVNTVLAEMSQQMGDELEGRYNSLSNEITVELEPVAQQYAEEIEAMNVQLRKIKQNMNKMYRNNNLYLRDMNEQLEGSIHTFLVKYGQAVSSFGQSVGNMRQRMSEITNEIQTFPFEEKYNEKVNEMIASLEEYRTQLENTLNSEKEVMVTKVTEALEQLREFLIRMTDEFSLAVSQTLDEIVQHPDVQNTKRHLEQMLTYIPDSPDLPEIDYQAYLNKVHKTIKSNLRSIKLAEHYADLVQGTQSAVSDQITELLQDEDLANAKHLIEELYAQLASIAENWQLTFNIREIATDIYESSREFITEDIGKLKLLNWHRNRFVVFDPENGNIEFEVYLPSPTAALDRIPKFSIKKYVARFNRAWEKYAVQLRDLSFWDVYYKYMPSCNPRDWIPPFKAYAIIAGNRHYITFDNKKFDFAGMCSYILAHDYHDKNFTVVVNFNRNRQSPAIRSMLVMTGGKNIEIFSSGIHVDGRPSELPFLHDELSVERDGNHVKLNTGRGLEVIGDVEHEHFVVGISGWYFGKVAGLLGTYDNEHFDDMMTSDGTITDDVDELSQSWQVNKRCRVPGNIIDQETFDEQSTGYAKCAALFKESSSPLRPCFKQVDTEYYMHMCMSGVQRGELVCDVASVYVKACQTRGVRMWLPQQCIQCETPNSDRYNAGETIKMNPASDDYQVPQSGDVVFVVESRQCNSEATRNLGKLVYKIDQGLTQSGMSGNRYGLISYGQRGASSHTIEGAFFNDATKFTKGVETLTHNDESSNSHDAILSATNYPFRTGVSKTIILVQCDECPEVSASVHDHLQHVLRTRDITLHILRDQEFRLDNNRIPKHKILGVDSSMKYMLDQSHADLYDDMSLPSDSCSALSLHSNGTIFDSTGFTSRRLKDRRIFSQIIVDRVAATAVPHECQVCQCVSDHTGAAMSICRKCANSFFDYLPQMWSNLKHPQTLRDEFEEQLKDYLGDGMDVFSR